MKLMNVYNILLIAGIELNCDEYYVRAVDLCNLDTVKKIFESINLNKDYPTLFICECVLIYLPVDKSNDFIKYCSDNYIDSLFAVYEQMKPEDPFGQIMIQNLIVFYNIIILG